MTSPIPIHIDCPMSELTLVRIRRNEAGNCNYWSPMGEVILIIECQDGLVVLVRGNRNETIRS